MIAESKDTVANAITIMGTGSVAMGWKIGRAHV